MQAQAQALQLRCDESRDDSWWQGMQVQEAAARMRKLLRNLESYRAHVRTLLEVELPAAQHLLSCLAADAGNARQHPHAISRITVQDVQHCHAMLAHELGCPVGAHTLNAASNVQFQGLPDCIVLQRLFSPAAVCLHGNLTSISYRMHKVTCAQQGHACRVSTSPCCAR